MSDWQLTALALVSLGRARPRIHCHVRLLRKHHNKQRPCRFCDLYPAASGSLWCGSVCADAEIGVLGKEITL